MYFTHIQTQNKDLIVETARSYIGVPWKHLGRSKLAVDCAGLIIEVGKEIEIVPQDFHFYTNYKRRPTQYNFKKEFDKHLYLKRTSEVEAGDVVVLKDDGIYPCHCGIIGFDEEEEELTLIHSSVRFRKVLEQPLTSEDWDKKITGTFWFKLK